MNSPQTETESKKLFERTRQELVTAQKSNAEAYDNALLTLSSAFLGISIAFIKDIVPLNEAIYACLLYMSWGMFSLTIITTITSFIYGQKGIKKLISAAEKYYLNGDSNAYSESEKISGKIDLFNTFSGVVFIGGVLLTVTFAIVNSTKVNSMTTDKKPTNEQLQKSQPANSFQKPANQQSNAQTNQGQQSKK